MLHYVLERAQLYFSFFFALLTFSFTIMVSPAFANEWDTVADVTINHSKPIYVRGVGYYTDNNLVSYDAKELTGKLRVVVTETSHPILNADGINRDGQPYFSLSTPQDVTRIYFGLARARLNYTALLQQQMSANVPPTITITAPTEAMPGSHVFVTMDVTDPDGYIDRYDFNVSSGVEIESDLDDDNLITLIIPDDYSDGTLRFHAKVTDNGGAEAQGEVTIRMVPLQKPIAFTQNRDSTPIKNVDIDVVVSPDSELTPATRDEQGYNTIVIDIGDEISIVPYSGSLQIVTGSMHDIQIGDVVVGVTQDGQQGFMRKVVAINGNTLITNPATIVEAFPNADISIHLSVHNGGGQVAVQTSNFSPMMGMASRSSVQLLSFSDRIEHDFSNGIKVVAGYNMSSLLNVDFDLSIWNRRIEQFSTIAEAGYGATGTIEYNIERSLSRTFSKDFTPLINKNILTYVGVIPLVINVKLTPELEGEVSVSAEGNLFAGFEVSGDYRTGFEYTYDAGLKRIKSFTPRLTRMGPDYMLTGSMLARAEAELEATVSLYEITIPIPFDDDIKFDGPGVGVEIGPYAQFSASVSKSNTIEGGTECDLSLKVGVASEVEIDYGLVGDALNIANPDDIPLFNVSRTLWTCDECPFEPEVGTLSGSVRDNEGKSISGAAIRLQAATNSFNATTDSSGSFAFSDIPVGTYRLAANKSGYIGDSMDVSLTTEGRNVTLTLIPDEEHEEDGLGDGDEDNNGGNRDEWDNPTKQGSSNGDPHLRTFDGLIYDFQGVGEYTYVVSDDGEFEIQARLKPWGNRRSVSLNAAIAALVEGDRVGLYPGQYGLVTMVNGKIFEPQPGHNDLPQGGVLEVNRSHHKIVWKDGSYASVSYRGAFINLSVTLSNSRFDKVRGLLGDFNGNRDTELFTREGDSFDMQASSFNDLYEIFGESWRVSKENTLFDYFDNESLEGFTDRTFPSGLTTQDNLREELGTAEYQRICELCLQYVKDEARLNACILDVALTGDTDALADFRNIATPRETFEPPSPPTVTITSPVPGSVLSSNVTFRGEISGDSPIIKLSVSFNGSEQIDFTDANTGESFAFSASLTDHLVEGANTIVIYAKDQDGNIGNATIGFTIDKSAAPEAGGDVVVLNDINIFDNPRIILEDNIQFSTNLVNFSGSGIHANGTEILWDMSRSPRYTNTSSFSTLFNTWTQAGYSVQIGWNKQFSSSIPPNIKLIVLFLPWEEFTSNEILNLKAFAAEGGRVLYIGEHAGYYQSTGIAIENDFLTQMGALMRNIGQAKYIGHSQEINADNDHQLLNGVERIYMSAVSLLELGPNDYPLITGPNGIDVIAAVARINLNYLPVISVNKMIPSVQSIIQSVAKPAIPSPIVFDDPARLYIPPGFTSNKE